MLCDCCGIKKDSINHKNDCFDINEINKRAILYLINNKLNVSDNLMNIYKFSFSKDYSYSFIDFNQINMDYFNYRLAFRFSKIFNNLPNEIQKYIGKYLSTKHSKTTICDFYVLRLNEYDGERILIIAPCNYMNFYTNTIIKKLGFNFKNTYHFFPTKSNSWFKSIIELI